MIALELIGQRFGRLLVVSKVGSINHKVWWRCQCDCGKTSEAPSSWLRSGNTKSCGCMGIEARTAATVKANRTHGMTRTPTYGVWFNMKRRCMNPQHKSYRYYGGRGIKVCDRWMDFAKFLEDMGERPAPDLSIERVEVNGNYEPGNCTWATHKEQQNNRRDNVRLALGDETKTAQQWAEDARCRVPWTAFLKRIDSGWPLMDALNRPARSGPGRAA